jgi:hypothetical protein
MNKKDEAGSAPAKILPKKIGPIKPRGKGKPFVEGYDPRRNVKGARPHNAKLLEQMIGDLFAEEFKAPDPTNSGNVEKVNQLYYMLRRMALSKAPADHTELLNRRFGTVAQTTRNQSEIDEFVLENYQLFTEGQTDRMIAGEDRREIFAEMLKDTIEENKRLKESLAKSKKKTKK